ncbi:carboxypeptidase regulatory-like domain-containing protein [Spirosoma areae]
MVRYFLVWFSLLLLSGLCINAQPLPITGYVHNESTQQPIESAYITVLNGSDSLVVAFARTNSKGAFSLNFTPEPVQSYLLKVSHISYRESTQALPTSQDLVRPILIQLKLGQLILNEVQVTARVPIREQGDSTRYRVNSFMNGSERTLEEVLKKMPNIRVEDNGDIYFKNQRVEKIFLDGDDLVGNTHQLATRSINPTLLNEVQAIEHFSENKLLRKIEQSNQTVLNLTVKNNRQTLLFGMLDAGGGPQRYDAVGNLFSYQKKLKGFSVLSANNVGTKRLEINDISTNVLADDRSTSEQLVIKPFTQTAQPFARNLNSPLENFNNERVGTFNVALTPLQKLKFTANLTLFQDRVWDARLQSVQLINDTPFSYQQSDTLHQHPTLAHLRLQAAYDWSKNTTLIYKGAFGTKTIKLDQTTYFTASGVASLFPQQFINTTEDNQHSFELTHKLSATNAVVVMMQATDTRLAERMYSRLNSLLAMEIFPFLPAGNTVLNQEINQRHQYYSGQFKWLYGIKKRKFEQRIGYSCSVFGVNFRQKINPVLVNSDTLNLSRQSLFSRTAAKLTGRVLEISGHLQIDLVNASIDTRGYNRALVQANLTTMCRLGSLSRVALAYDRQVNPVANSLLINKIIITDFRSAQEGYQSLLFDNRDQLSVSYTYTDVALRKMTFFATLFALRSNDLWSLSNYRLLSDYSVLSLINTPHINTCGANLLLEKLVYPLSGNIRLDAKLMRNKFQQVVNGQLRTTIGYIPMATAKYISVFESPFNVETGATYQRTVLTAFQSEQSLQQSFTMLNAYIRLFYRQKKYQLDLTGEINQIQQNTFSFLKGNVNYQFSPKLQLRLEGTNLLNQTVNRQLGITPTTYSEGTYPLLNRMVLLYARYSF